MHLRLLKAIIALPVTVTIVIPSIILFFAGINIINPDKISFWVAVIIAVLALGLSIWTMTLFVTIGKGTPAPWDPPQKLVINGPYRYVRNPMLTSVFFILLAEVIFFQSLPLFFWFITFIAINLFYFPFFEEKALEKKFGDEYLRYKANVPRYIPRLTPWDPDA
jgi:protein-S-isoprenylcysteine O-methyltransferase Ste14